MKFGEFPNLDAYILRHYILYFIKSQPEDYLEKERKREILILFEQH